MDNKLGRYLTIISCALPRLSKDNHSDNGRNLGKSTITHTVSGISYVISRPENRKSFSDFSLGKEKGPMGIGPEREEEYRAIPPEGIS